MITPTHIRDGLPVRLAKISAGPVTNTTPTKTRRTTENTLITFLAFSPR